MIRWGAAAAAFALLAFTTPATAHRGDPTIVARIDAVDPPLEGVTVMVRAGVADQLFVVNGTADVVEVLGRDGAPFLRIAKDSVSANVRSPDWVTSLSPFATTPPPAAAPEWRTVADHGSWGWFDHRMHDADRALTPALRAARTPVRLADWNVPLRHRNTTHTVRGHVEYRPVVGAFRSRTTAVPDGAKVDVLDGRVPGLFVRWEGSGTLTLQGSDGKPFARFTKDGVEVNERSATWRDDRALQGKTAPPETDPQPLWRRQNATPTLTWLDRRLAYTPGVPSEDALRRTTPTTMVEWEVAGDVDGRPVAIRGETTWHPDAQPRETDRRGIAAAAIAAVAVLGAVLYRRRARGTAH